VVTREQRQALCGRTPDLSQLPTLGPLKHDTGTQDKRWERLVACSRTKLGMTLETTQPTLLYGQPRSCEVA